MITDPEDESLKVAAVEGCSFRSVKRGDPVGVRTLGECLPGCMEFRAMYLAPLVDQIMGALRESPSQQLRRLDVEQGLVLAVAGVEMRRAMIAGVHRDHDAEKAAELRHCRLVSDC